jgi:hypothetical protein
MNYEVIKVTNNNVKLSVSTSREIICCNRLSEHDSTVIYIGKGDNEIVAKIMRKEGVRNRQFRRSVLIYEGGNDSFLGSGRPDYYVKVLRRRALYRMVDPSSFSRTPGRRNTDPGPFKCQPTLNGLYYFSNHPGNYPLAKWRTFRITRPNLNENSFRSFAAMPKG